MAFSCTISIASYLQRLDALNLYNWLVCFRPTQSPLPHPLTISYLLMAVWYTCHSPPRLQACQYSLHLSHQLIRLVRCMDQNHSL